MTSVSEDLIYDIHKLFDSLQDYSHTTQMNLEAKNFQVGLLGGSYDDVFKEVEYIRNQPWEDFKDKQLHNIKNNLSDIVSTFSDLNLAISRGRQDYPYKSNIKNCYTKLIQLGKTIQGYLRSNDSDKRVVLHNTIRKMEEEQQQIKSKLDSTQSEVLVKAVDTASTHFKTTADNHKQQSRLWAAISAILAFFTVYYAYTFLDLAVQNTPPLDEKSQYEFIRLSATSLFFVTFLLSATIWSARIYKSHVHIEVSNRHRETTLKVVDELRRSADGEPAKDIIVTEAARAIFSDPQTGFIIDKSSDNSTSFNIGDLIKSDVK